MMNQASATTAIRVIIIITTIFSTTSNSKRSGNHAAYERHIGNFIRDTSTPISDLPYVRLTKPTCVGEHFNLTVTRRRCVSRTITNMFCNGLCNSFYVPGGQGVRSGNSQV